MACYMLSRNNVSHILLNAKHTMLDKREGLSFSYDFYVLLPCYVKNYRVWGVKSIMILFSFQLAILTGCSGVLIFNLIFYVFTPRLPHQ